MKRKLILSMLIVAALGAAITSCSAQDKALRAQKKAEQAMLDSINSIRAFKAMEQKVFLVKFDRIAGRRGGNVSANNNLNFAYVNGTQGAIQVGSAFAPPGPNGVGGITLSGQVRNYEYSLDKKGNGIVSYMVAGQGMSASVRVKLPKNGTYAHVEIDANYGPGRIDADGTLLPYSATEVVKGYPD